MRELADSVLAIPIAGVRMISRSTHSLRFQVFLTLIATLALVGGMVFILPAASVQATGPTPYDPAVPTAQLPEKIDSLTVDQPFIVQFSKPMNQGSVADALSISPSVGVRLIWDSAGRQLSVAPATAWAAFTKYKLKVSENAMDQSGIKLGKALTASFETGALTSALIEATIKQDNLVAPTTSFKITFSRPVKLATVEARLSIMPAITGSITGDDPTDVASQVFTFTPADGLMGNTQYTIRFDTDGATDANGSALLTVAPLVVTTQDAPGVLRFRPAAGGSTRDPNQVVSVRFTMPLDRVSTAAAFGLYVNGKRARGQISWSEGDTVLVVDPYFAFPIGSTVKMVVNSTARSKTGMRLNQTYTGSFSVRKYTVRRIPWLGVKQTDSPWYSSEVYYWNLVNCTRTGGWVTSSGNCSSVGHHVMEAQGRLSLHAGLSAVARSYSKQLALRGALTHYLDGTNPHQRLAAAGYPSGTWGENLASPSSVGASGMIRVEIFFQNEYRCKYRSCEFGHYLNIMYPYFHRVGIGIWVANGHVRVTSEFYG